jgi:tRNA-modifying protein YgfZ
MNTIERQRRAAHEAALIQPRPDLGTLAVSGADRKSWLNGLLTCDVAALSPGQGAYGLCVVKTGKILAEIWLTVAEDRILLGAAADRVELLREHLDRHLIMEDVELVDASAEHAWVFTHGPLSAQLVLLARGELGATAAALVDWTGRGDAGVVIGPRARAEEVCDALLGHAGEAGALATREGFEQLRIEWGVPRFGVDFDDQSLPQEASLERLAVSFSKGCYLGQETVFMLEKRGHVKRKLVRIAVEGEGSLPAGTPVALPDGTEVGSVTSSAPRPGGLVALGYVKYKSATPDTALSVAGRPALVVAPAGGAGAAC